MDHQAGICHAGECGSMGTQERDTNGACFCKGNFVGLKCDHCARGYIGSACDQCDEHFYLVDGLCLPCSIRGTEHNFGIQKYNEDGTCKCYPWFSGAVCQECAPGHHGTLCQYCNEGFYMHKKMCFGTAAQQFFQLQLIVQLLFSLLAGECEANGTRHTNTFGECICHPGYGGSNCDRCAPGAFGEGCEFCADDYFKSPYDGSCRKGQCVAEFTANRTEKGSCQCQKGFGGGRCEKCAAGTIGPKCDACDSGYFANVTTGLCQGMLIKVSYQKYYILLLVLVQPACKCVEEYSKSDICDATTGQCPCLAGFQGRTCESCVTGYSGKKCDACADGYHRSYSDKYSVDSTVITCLGKKCGKSLIYLT